MKPAQVTEAHKALWTKLYNLAHDEIFDVASSDGPATQLIADSEAKAAEVAEEKIRALWRQGIQADSEQFNAVVSERNQLRAETAEREVERLKQDAEIEFERRNEQQQMDNESANRDIALFKSRAERAEATLADFRRGNMRLHGYMSGFQRATERAEKAEAELAKALSESAKLRADFFDFKKRTWEHDEYNARVMSERSIERDKLLDELAKERAARGDLVADLLDACVTLASINEDCDDYAMQNTGFKVDAVRDVLLQYIPVAAIKESK